MNINFKNSSLEDRIFIKNQIKEYLETNNLAGAEIFIDTYESKYYNDIEIYSFKGILNVLKNDFKSAENILKEGLKITNDNFDLNYNLGFVYENLNQNELAIKYYGIALTNTSSECIKTQIKSLLSNLIK